MRKQLDPNRAATFLSANETTAKQKKRRSRVIVLIRRSLARVLDLVCPPNCVVCGMPLETETPVHFICKTCCSEIVIDANDYCHRCGALKSVMPISGINPDFCWECQQYVFAFSSVFVLGEYQGLLRQMVLRMKQDRDGLLSTNAAQLFLEKRGEKLQQLNIDLVLPVPMHFLRRFLRGVNSPNDFAREISHFLKVPVALRHLKRIRYTKPQFLLKPKQRLKNVKGAFAYTGAQNALQGKTVLIVDDILTTGATSNEVAKVLINAGAKTVYVAVFSQAATKLKSDQK